MYDNGEDAFFMFLLYIAAFIVSIFVTRAIFSIPKFLRYQRAQLKLAALMAYQNGVDPRKIKSILDIADGAEDETSGNLLSDALKGEKEAVLEKPTAIT